MPCRLTATACALGLSWGAAAAEPPALDALLERAGQYVARFVEQFSNVVAEERYVQDIVAPLLVTRSGGGPPFRPQPRHRELKSDFLLVKVGKLDWLPFRDVYEVDGSAVHDREGRLAKLFLQPWATALDQANQIATESARYNIGALQRTINTPILPLVFLYGDMQPRFRFALGKHEGGAGSLWVVEYKEEARPTLIRGRGDSDFPAAGRFWIDPDTGRVAKTELDMDGAGIRARLTTLFRRDDRFQIDVPFEMQEQYTLDRGTVTGTAVYSHFRRFEVSADQSFRDPPEKGPDEK